MGLKLMTLRSRPDLRSRVRYFTDWAIRALQHGFFYFRFILFGVHSASWICMFTSFAKFGGMFSHIFNCFSAPFSCFPSGVPVTWMLDLLFLFHVSPRLVLFFFFFNFFCYSDWAISVIQSASSLILSPSSPFCCEDYLLSFYFSVIFLSSKISIWFFFISSISLIRLFLYCDFLFFHTFQVFVIAHWTLPLSDILVWQF